MTRPLIPPRYVNIPPGILFNDALPDGAKVFYAQVRALAWQSGYKSTPPLTMEELESITGRKKSAIYGYMTALRITTALLWHTSQGKTFIFSFPEPAHSMIPESSIVLSSSDSLTDKYTEREKEQEEIPSFQISGITELPQYQALNTSGVREPKLSALAQLPWMTAEYVLAHVNLAKSQGYTLGTAISRMENHWLVEDCATAPAPEGRRQNFDPSASPFGEYIG